MEREKFKSRLGFILISAGCAIGIGNVWRFPYVVGNNGGGIFVLFYLLFLCIMGIPILSMEFAVGRASGHSAALSFRDLEKPGQKWHFHGKTAMFGCYMLMFYYTTVAGWMLYYFYASLKGGFAGLDTQGVADYFSGLLSNPAYMVVCVFLVVLLGFLVCSLGLQNGVERITKVMMLALLIIMVALAINSISIPGASEGLKFYLVPNWAQVEKVGLFQVIVAAMNQAFFTLSLGIGAMNIFGSYIGKDKSLLGESITIAALDTFVAIVAGLIIFPACFAYGVNPDSGPSLIFITLPNIFNKMPGGRLWSGLFFLFMFFAAFSTVIAVFENLMRSCMDLFNWSRRKTALINFFVVLVFSIPCILGFNVWGNVHLLGASSSILDFEDFLVSTLLLPLGSLVYLLFCTSKKGWGWQAFLEEVNQGSGLKFPKGLRVYLTYILPILMLFIIINGIYTTFAG
jgi:NSS family neurotransmitter:Na+ symporter